MLRRILVVDDNDINRLVLQKILSEEYEVIQAQDGVEALGILRKEGDGLSAVLLDLEMPEADGYEVLRIMREDERMRQVPVIVTTGTTDTEAENKALSLGATDFVTKPYNSKTIRHRLRNIITLRETSAIVNAARRDELTGLFNRRVFFDTAADMIASHEPGYYVMACFDVDNFKVINDQYGSEMGDEVLRALAKIFSEYFDPIGGLCSRITADNFAVLYPRSFLNSPDIEALWRRASTPISSVPPITFSVGRYLVDDLSLSVSAMYDRASIAQNSVKGRFDRHSATYDESMRAQILRVQEITGEMKSALDDGQFEVWFQPQYNHTTGALIGSEALVRWRHPVRGLIPPSEFIPVFERNGFIYELDKFVWENTCADLRRWLDAGRNPLPVSVNISRYDLFRADFFESLTDILKKYDLPVELLRLEITESAFADSTEHIIDVVRRLSDSGFTVEIDDFGSGYSSLNTLKDVPAQVLKLDMRFLENDENSQRGGNILESIVRMSKWLGMSVIAEGVETAAQADFLKTIGCSYVQGYLYARPMPVEEYEALARTISKEEKLLVLETVENLNTNSFWDPSSMDTLIFNSYVGGACIFEWHNDKIEILRANDKYAKTIGGEGCTVEDALGLVWEDHMDEAAAAATKDAILRTIETGDDVTYEAAYTDLLGNPGKTYLKTTFRAIARTSNRFLLYATNENITAQREAELKERRVSEQLQAIMDNISSGITAVTTRGEEVDYLFTNDRYYEMFGYTREQYHSEVKNTFDLIHPDDRQRVLKAVERINETKEPAVLDYRVIRRDGSTMWERNFISVAKFDGIDTPVQLGVATDVTAEKQAQAKLRESETKLQAILDNINGGVSVTALEDGVINYIFANEQYYSMLGYTKEQFERELPGGIFDAVHPDDRKYVYDATVSDDSEFRDATVEFRVYRRDKSLIWVRGIGSAFSLEGYDRPVHIGIIYDITREKEAELRIRSLNENLTDLMNDMPGGFARMRLEADGAIKIDYVNEGLCRLRGMTREEIMKEYGDDALRATHPDDIVLVTNAVAEMLSSGKSRGVDYRLLNGDGGYTRYHVFGRASKNENGETFINVYYADLSEKEKTAPAASQ